MEETKNKMKFEIDHSKYEEAYIEECDIDAELLGLFEGENE